MYQACGSLSSQRLSLKEPKTSKGRDGHKERKERKVVGKLLPKKERKSPNQLKRESRFISSSSGVNNEIR